MNTSEIKNTPPLLVFAIIHRKYHSSFYHENKPVGVCHKMSATMVGRPRKFSIPKTAKLLNIYRGG